VSHPVRAVVVELAAYEVILIKPWFTRHNPIVDWRRHQLRLVIYGRTAVVDASASPQCKPSQDVTRISATQLKKVVRRQEPVYLVHLGHIGVEPDPEKGSHLPNAWECMLDEFSDVFPCRPIRSTPRTFSRYVDRTGGRGEASGETCV
jgi:hypothetical protein